MRKGFGPRGRYLLLRYLLLVAAAFLLSACAGRPDWQHEEQLLAATDQQPARLLDHVPFHAQERYQCGPASLAMMLNAEAIPVHPDDLVNRVYLPKRGGTLQVELVSAAREQGLVVYPLAKTPDAVVTEVAAGHPVLVMQNLRFSWWPQWHYAVVVGYDLPARQLILHTGLQEAYRQPLTTFMRTWERADQWAVVMVDPGKLPATAEPLPYLRAASDLESTRQFKAAYRAYQTAFNAWPDQPAARFGLGNMASALGQNSLSVEHLLILTHEWPHLAQGWNNLAVMLARTGCPLAAAAALDCARERDSRFADTVLESSTATDTKACPVIACPESSAP